jgi:hypothetical protein
MPQTRHPAGPTMACHVAVALETLPPARRDRVAACRAAMYAEAIDDDDEGDGLFRFWARLRTALEALGLAPVARQLRLPLPVSDEPPEPSPVSLAVGAGGQVCPGPWPKWRSEDAQAA